MGKVMFGVFLCILLISSVSAVVIYIPDPDLSGGDFLYDEDGTIYFNESQLNVTITGTPANNTLQDVVDLDPNLNSDIISTADAYFRDVNVSRDLYVSNSTIRIGDVNLSSAQDIFLVNGKQILFKGDNIFDQTLNTTDNVTFRNVNITEDLYVSNSTIYVGNVSVSSFNGELKVAGILNATEGLAGDGSRITNLNLTGVSIDGDSINASFFNGGNFTGDYFEGVFSWIETSPYLSFNGTTLEFDADLLNLTITDSGANASWNEGYADTLYSSIIWNYNQTEAANAYTDSQIAGVIPDNSSWNEQYANNLYADIIWGYNMTDGYLSEYDYNHTSVLESGIFWYNQTAPANAYADGLFSAVTQDNASWNQSYANTLYADIIWNYNQSDGYLSEYDYNHTIVSNAYSDSLFSTIVQDNESWNEQYANSLYSNIIWGYNMTTAANSYTDEQFALIVQDNSSWNEQYANSLYSNIIWGYNMTTPATDYADSLFATVVQDNSSWNESYASSIYADIIWGYNQTIPANAYTDLQVGSITPDNVSWNQSYSDSLYADIIWNYNQSDGYLSEFDYNHTSVIENGIYWYNMTDGYLSEFDYNHTTIANSYTDSQVGAVVQDNSSWNETYADTRYAGIIWGYNMTDGYLSEFDYNHTNVIENGIYWYNMSDGYLSEFDYNHTTIANAYTDSQIANVVQDNSSWNETYANTLYADIIWNYNQSDGYLSEFDYNHTEVANSYTDSQFALIVQDNSSWNESYADTLYAAIAWGYNMTTPANTYTDNQISFVNTTINILNLLEGTDVYSTYNATYDAKEPGNSSWNETYADSLYVNADGDIITGDLLFLNASLDNLSHIQFNPEGNNCGDSEYCMEVDVDNGVLVLTLPGGEVKLQIGQEFQIPRSNNDHGSTIYNGQIIYISGATGSNPDVKLVDFSSYRQVQAISGMVTQNLVGSSQKGYYTSSGVVRDLDTSACADGGQVFGDPLVPGNWTCNFPGEEYPIAFLGIVLRSHATEGEIWFNHDYLPRLSDLSFVNETNQRAYDYSILQYDNSTGLTEYTDSPTFGSVTANWFNGLFNWTSVSDYLTFNGANLDFNDTLLNETIDSRASINSFEENITVTVSGGIGTATSSGIFDYLITQIIVTPTSPTNTYNFEAIENSDSSMIDRNRIQHTGEWNIQKTHSINDQVFVNITGASIDENFNVQIKYIDNAIQ